MKLIDDKLLIMSSSLHAGSMQQSKHNNFEQTHLLINISANGVALWTCLPKALIRKEMRGIDSVNKLQSMVDRYCMQHVGLVQSGQRRKHYLLVRMFGCTVGLSSIFAE